MSVIEPTSFTLDARGANGIPFRVVATQPGETNNWQWTAEIYDRRFDHTEHGQFTGGRYYVETLLESRHAGHGLNIHGGVPDWTLDARTFGHVRMWLSCFVGITLKDVPVRSEV